MSAKNWLITSAVVSVLGAGGYLIYRFWDKISNFNKGTAYEGSGIIGSLGNATNQVLGGAPAALGESIGGGLYDVFHPAENIGPDTFYTVNFPDGSRHSVHATDVSKDGVFQYGTDQTIYQLVTRQGLKYAQIL